MAFRLDGTSCVQCGGVRRGISLTATGRLLCPQCLALAPDLPGRGTLQRLFRIRPRFAADGKTLVFERYEG